MSAPTVSTYRSGLDTDVQFLKGVGPKLAAMLAKANLKTVRDVLFYLPRRYEDRRNLPPISSLRPGDWATVRGRVMSVEGNPTRRGMVVIRAILSDGRSSIGLTWFNQPWIKKKLSEAKGELIAYGQVKENNYHLEIHSPEYEFLEEDSESAEFAKITPVYPLVDGVFQSVVRKAAASAVDNYLQYVVDPLPPHILTSQKLKPLQWALKEIHHPTTEENRAEARRRLVFDEFFTMQVALALRRSASHIELGIGFEIDEPKLLEESHGLFPFDFTNAQRRVIKEIWTDMEAPHPMNRLVQGDVGSGKTAVAACAMLAAVRSGYQAVMMAPTEILAEQHYVNLRQIFEPVGIEVVLLVGKQTKTEKKKAYEHTATGTARIAVGTHALIQEGVEFKHLGFVVIDEQHRFGVLQRAALREKGLGNPDVLVMTATPIPRTLTMTAFGDLDLSVIDELPPGRRPIKTHWMRLQDRAAVYQGVRKLIEDKRQAYIVCALVSENENQMALAAEELYERLTKEVFPDLRIGLLHGQMKSKDKEAVMEQFRKHELDIIVSTTVIEVGVDVPNASAMVIEDANRFGLSQLHQLRGRVGRGANQSFCILVADARTEDAKARLDIMVATSDGFKIAEEDLKLRGPGEIAGTKQSGNLDFKIGDLVQDGKMMEVARQAAINLVKRDPTLSHPAHKRILEAARERGARMTTITVS